MVEHQRGVTRFSEQLRIDALRLLLHAVHRAAYDDGPELFTRLPCARTIEDAGQGESVLLLFECYRCTIHAFDGRTYDFPFIYTWLLCRQDGRYHQQDAG